MAQTALPGDTLLAEFAATVAYSGVVPATADLLHRLQSPLLAAGVWTDVVVGLARTGFAPVAVEVAEYSV